MYRDSIMAFITHRSHQKRKGYRRSLFAHISRHNSTKTAHRRGRRQRRPEQIRTTSTVCDKKQVCVSPTILITPSNHQIRDNKTVKSWTCKSIAIPLIGRTAFANFFGDF